MPARLLRDFLLLAGERQTTVTLTVSPLTLDLTLGGVTVSGAPQAVTVGALAWTLTLGTPTVAAGAAVTVGPLTLDLTLGAATVGAAPVGAALLLLL